MSLATNSRFSRYLVNDQVGVGSTGKVYRCHDPLKGRDVALKILFPENGVQDDQTVAQFIEEALIMKSLVHDSIPEFYESGNENGVHYIVSEFLEGKPLCGPMSVSELMIIAEQIGAGIIAMHEAGVVHRDIKPKNLIMTSAGRVKIIDFGRASRLTPVMAADPEQLAQWQWLVRAEQLTLGMVLYELATGRGPFRDRETSRTLSGLLGEQLVTLTSEGKSVLLDALKKCAAKDGSNSWLLLVAMSLAFSLAGPPGSAGEI